jgi:hypothetical protein
MKGQDFDRKVEKKGNIETPDTEKRDKMACLRQ